MTFSLEFDLLMIGVCTFIKKKNKNKKRKKKQKQKKTNNKKKQKKNKETKKKGCKDMLMSHILLHWVFVVGFLLLGSSLGVWVRFL